MGATLKVLFPYFIQSLQNRATPRPGHARATNITLKELIDWDFEEIDALLHRYAAMSHEIYHSLSSIT
jgi:hypothetical protein